MKNDVQKKLRWYIVEGEEETAVIAAYSHSRAKIEYGCNITGQFSRWEAMSNLNCKLLKVEVSTQPNHEGELFFDWSELLKLGVFHSYYHDYPCQHCGREEKYSSNYQYWNDMEKRFYCDKCKDSPKLFSMAFLRKWMHKLFNV